MTATVTAKTAVAAVERPVSAASTRITPSGRASRNAHWCETPRSRGFSGSALSGLNADRGQAATVADASRPRPCSDRTQDMRYRRLGSSDLEVSEISLGSWLTFGVGVERDKAKACVDRAFELDINFIDTANVYGRGAAEEFLGEALAGPAARLLRAGDEALLPHVRHGQGPLARAGREADRRVAGAAADRLRRPVPVPPLRREHAARGDDGGAHRGRPLRQGALHRVQRVDGGADPGRARPARRREVRVEPAAVLDPPPQAGGGRDPALRRERDLADRVLAARAGRADRASTGRRAAAAGLARRLGGDGLGDGPVPHATR